MSRSARSWYSQRPIVLAIDAAPAALSEPERPILLAFARLNNIDNSISTFLLPFILQGFGLKSSNALLAP
jgi:hypothetical protein